MKFQRGNNPKKALEIGMDAIAKKFSGYILREEDLNTKYDSIDDVGPITEEAEPQLPEDLWYKSLFVVIVIKGKYRILKNHLGKYSGTKEEWIGNVEDLPKLIQKIHDLHNKKINEGIIFISGGYCLEYSVDHGGWVPQRGDGKINTYEIPKRK